MNLISLITFLMTATPDEAGLGSAPEKDKVRLGLSAAFGAGPLFDSSTGSLWWTGELAGFIELPLSRFSLRTGVGLRAGFAQYFPRVGANLGVELRFHVIPRFSIGLGVDATYSMYWIQEGGPRARPPDRYDVFQLSATLTPAAVRLGERHNHELSLSASMVTGIIRVEGILVFVRYAYLF